MKSMLLKSGAVLAGMAILAVGTAVSAPPRAMADAGWAFKGTWSDTCSCKVPCPCFFASGPTEHFCEGTLLLEVETGHYGGVEIDGLAAIVTLRIGKWTRIYVSDAATPEQAEAFASVIPLTLPFLREGEIETLEIVPLSVERTETMVKYSSPESSVELEIVTGDNGEPIQVANLPVKGLPFPEIHDHRQYRSVLSKHDSDAHHFEWSGRNGMVAKVDRAGDLPAAHQRD